MYSSFHSTLRRIRIQLFPSYPTLPLEILQLIIYEAWHLPFTGSERIHFMTVSMLVNRTWLKAFIMTCFRDMVLPCAAYFHYIFLTVVPGHSTVFSPSFASLGLKPEMISHLCRSLAFHMEDDRDIYFASCRMYCRLQGVRGSTKPLLFPIIYELGRMPGDISRLLPNVHKLAMKFHRVLPSKYDFIRTLVAISSTKLRDMISNLEVGYDWDTETPRCILNVLSSRSSSQVFGPRDATMIQKMMNNRFYKVGNCLTMGWDGGFGVTKDSFKEEFQTAGYVPPDDMLGIDPEILQNIRKLEVYGVSEEVVLNVVRHFVSSNLVELCSELPLCLTNTLSCVRVERDIRTTWSNSRNSKLLCYYHDGPHRYHRGCHWRRGVEVPSNYVYYYSSGSTCKSFDYGLNYNEYGFST